MQLKKLFSREHSVQYCEASIRSLSNEVAEHIPHIIQSQCYIPEQGNEACYFDTQEFESFMDGLTQWTEDEDKLDNFVKKFHQFGDDYVSISKEIGAKVDKKTNFEQLLHYYSTYIEILNVYSAYLWMGHLLNSIISKKGEVYLKEKEKDSKTLYDDNVYSALFSPEKKNGILLMHDELLQLKNLNSKSEIDRNLELIAKKYQWMPCLDLQNNPWEVNDVKKYFDELSDVPIHVSDFDMMCKKIDLNVTGKALFQRVRTFAYIKDARDVYRRQGIYNILPLFDAIASKVDSSRHDIAFLTNKEIMNLLHTKTVAPESKIRARKKGFLIYSENEAIKVVTDSDLIATFVSKNILNQSQEKTLTGTIASKGIVSGSVKIVLGVGDLSKVEINDILVANTTHPDFIPAMQRAAAFVTDEGGLTSHAAIVAREMGKPCIVGARRATTALKDGMKVKVDANTGIITIVN